MQRKTDNKGTPSDRERRISYYVSQQALKHGYDSCPIKSINASHLDDIARGLVLDHMASKGLQTAFNDASKRDAVIRDLIRGVVVGPDQITIELDTARLQQCERSPRGAATERPNACVFVPEVEERTGTVVLTLAIQIKKLDGRRLLIAPDGQDLLARQAGLGAPTPDPTIVNAIGLAYAALRAIASEGASVMATAQRLRVPRSTITYLLPLTQLGPATLRASLEGTLPPRTTVKRLVRVARHLDWDHQVRALKRERTGGNQQRRDNR